MKRRILILLTAFVLTTALPFTGYATERIRGNDYLPQDFKLEEMRAEIMMSVNVFQREFPRELKFEDIDLSRAYKIYMTNVFEIETNDFKVLTSILEQKENCIFVVPIYFENGDVYVANIQRRNPLPENADEIFTKNEIDRHKQSVGHWVVSAVSQYLANDIPFVDYYDVVRDSIIETRTLPILVGGLPYFKWTVALFPDEAGNISRIVPIDPGMADWSGLRSSRQQTFKEKGWLDYSETKSFLSANPPRANPDIAGGNAGGGIEPLALFMIYVTCVLIFISLICFRIHRRRAKVNHSN